MAPVETESNKIAALPERLPSSSKAGNGAAGGSGRAAELIKLRSRTAAVGAKTAFIKLGSPWENGYCESFNAKQRDELLNGETFYSRAEAKTVIESWRQHYNTRCPTPHSATSHRPRRYHVGVKQGREADHALV
jgi:transposase InsO family protein